MRGSWRSADTSRPGWSPTTSSPSRWTPATSGSAAGWASPAAGSPARTRPWPTWPWPPAARRWPPAACPPADIDLVIVATCTAEAPIPNTAATVATRLGIVAPGAFDLNAACAGFCYALGTASDAVRAGTSRHVLVIGAEKLSQWIDWTDRSTCIIFADGAGRRGGRAGRDGEQRRHRARWSGASDGEHGRHDLHQGPPVVPPPGGAGGVPLGHHRAAPGRPGGLRAGRASAPRELAAFVPHQANLRIIEAIARKLGRAQARGRPRHRQRRATPRRRPSRSPCRAMIERGEVRLGRPGPAARLRGGLTYAAQVITVP